MRTSTGKLLTYEQHGVISRSKPPWGVTLLSGQGRPYLTAVLFSEDEVGVETSRIVTDVRLPKRWRAPLRGWGSGFAGDRLAEELLSFFGGLYGLN